jgi:hypothetical protein
MKNRSGSCLSLFVATAALAAAAADAGAPTYDLSGTWRLNAVNIERSFCDGSSSQTPQTGIVLITQSGEDLTLTLLDPPDNQVFQGRTSSFFLGVEQDTGDAVTVITGSISPDATRINGSLVFLDRHPCPEAETGSATFRLTRIN